MVKALDKMAVLVRVSVSNNKVAGACGVSPPANSVAFTNASCLLHFSYNSINWMASPVPGIAVAAKAAVSVGFGVHLQVGSFVRMEWAF